MESVGPCGWMFGRLKVKENRGQKSSGAGQGDAKSFEINRRAVGSSRGNSSRSDRGLLVQNLAAAAAAQVRL